MSFCSLLMMFGSGSKKMKTKYAIFVPKKECAMTDITYVQQLRETISGEFYFGTMCRETKRRIAISTDTSRGNQRYSQSGETIVSCSHCHKTDRLDNRDIFSFPSSSTSRQWRRSVRRSRIVPAAYQRGDRV